MNFVHLHCHTPFSFLDGASQVEELVRRAAELEMPALAVTDHNNLSAAVQFAQAAAKFGLKAIQGTEVSLADGSHLTLLAEDERGYASLCRLITRAHLSNPRGQPAVRATDLEELPGVIVLSGCRQGLIPRSILKGDYRQARQQAAECAQEAQRERPMIGVVGVQRGADVRAEKPEHDHDRRDRDGEAPPHARIGVMEICRRCHGRPPVRVASGCASGAHTYWNMTH